jgi:hypothetical protein
MFAHEIKDHRKPLEVLGDRTLSRGVRIIVWMPVSSGVSNGRCEATLGGALAPSDEGRLGFVSGRVARGFVARFFFAFGFWASLS